MRTSSRSAGVAVWMVATIFLGSCASGERPLDPTDAFILPAASVAPFSGARRAAVSYTFDDGPSSSFALAQLFEDRGLRATFFVNPGRIAEADWPRWSALSAAGHEIGNHSMNHLDLSDPALDDAALSHQIEDAQLLIEARLGVRPLSFAFPHDRWNARSAAMVLRSHLATRTPTLPFRGPDYRVLRARSATTSDDLDAALARAITRGAWLVVAGHGIDGDGWQPLPSGVLARHLDHAVGREGDVWVDTFGNIARYRLARERAHVTATAVSPRSMHLEVQGAQDPVLGAVALTVQIPVLGWPVALRVRDPAGADVPYRWAAIDRGLDDPRAVQGQEFLLVDLRPSEAVEIEISE